MKVLIPLADGCEEMEAVILTDILRRAAWDVVTAGLSGVAVTASRGVVLMPDQQWDDVNPADFDMILLPGGMDGTYALCDHDGVQDTLRDFDAAGKRIGAICAAALALFKAGILVNRRFTCYPGVEKEMGDGFHRLEEPVVVDGNLITSQGPGTAFEFALAIIEIGESKEAADSVRKGLLL
ncbi:MAG: DJ-1/PfpI family protein [Kiritimatiellales bacterium]|nr:DJ-1/PfpI family protein [Kiritimatiellales bacterium]